MGAIATTNRPFGWACRRMNGSKNAVLVVDLCHAPPDFVRSVNPISIRGGRSCPPNDTSTPEFSDLPTTLRRFKLLEVKHNLILPVVPKIALN